MKICARRMKDIFNQVNTSREGETKAKKIFKHLFYNTYYWRSIAIFKIGRSTHFKVFKTHGNVQGFEF